jgi:hypothetical protein
LAKGVAGAVALAAIGEGVGRAAGVAFGDVAGDALLDPAGAATGDSVTGTAAVGAVAAACDRATETAAEPGFARVLACLHHATAETVASKTIATAATKCGISRLGRLCRSGAYRLGSERAKLDDSLLKARRSSSSARHASQESK